MLFRSRQLLTRPVFDPETFGRTRLHNDNDGVVRAYLAARWLMRLREANLSKRELYSLLFGAEYGVATVIPSARETAAWLSLWDWGVAQEVAKREPWILLTGGDPGSLPVRTREQALRQVVQWLGVPGNAIPVLDHDSLRRFATEELAPTVRKLWEQTTEREARRLLLRLMWFGKVRGCADLAGSVAMSDEFDVRLRVLAGRAVVVGGGDELKRRYVQYLFDHLLEVPITMIWDAIEEIFPTHLTVDQLFAITAAVDVTDSGEVAGFAYVGPRVVQRLKNKAEIEHLLDGFLQQVGPAQGNLGDRPTAREEAYIPVIATLACEVLCLTDPNGAPALAIDAALRIGQEHHALNSSWEAVKQLPALLLNSPARRRSAFWEAARKLKTHPLLTRALDSTNLMRMLSWHPRLQIADLEWLLADGPGRADRSERQLSINTALELVWREPNRTQRIERIGAVAAKDPDMKKTFDEAVTPRERTAEDQARDARMAELRDRNEARRTEIDQGWLKFVNDLKANPTKLADFAPTIENPVDGRVVSLAAAADGNRKQSLLHRQPCARGSVLGRGAHRGIPASIDPIVAGPAADRGERQAAWGAQPDLLRGLRWRNGCRTRSEGQLCLGYAAHGLGSNSGHDVRNTRAKRLSELARTPR